MSGASLARPGPGSPSSSGRQRSGDERDVARRWEAASRGDALARSRRPLCGLWRTGRAAYWR